MLSEKQFEAARLVARGRTTLVEIAQLVGVSRRTIANWKANRAFRAEVARMDQAWRDRARKTGIGDPDRRLLRINERWRKLQTVIEERAKDPQMQDVPGGKTGLLTVTYKTRTLVDYSGEKPERSTELVPEYEVDTGMLAEMRQLEEHAAIHEGQWKKKIDVEKRSKLDVDVSPEAMTLARLLTPAQLDELEAKLKASQGEDNIGDEKV